MQGAEYKKGGLKPFNLCGVVGEWAGSMMRLLMGGPTRYLLVRWAPLLLHRTGVSLSPRRGVLPSPSLRFSLSNRGTIFFYSVPGTGPSRRLFLGSALIFRHSCLSSRISNDFRISRRVDSLLLFLKHYT